MKRLLHWLHAGAEWLAMRAGQLASVALLIMTIGVTLDVLARFFLGAGSKMAIEMSGYALVAIVFMGLAYTHKTNGHIEINFLIKRLSARAQHRCRVFNSIVFLAYTMLLGYFGWKSFWTSFQFSSTSRTGLDVLIWPYQLVIPLGLLITSALLITSICVDIARGIRHATDDAAEAAS